MMRNIGPCYRAASRPADDDRTKHPGASLNIPTVPLLHSSAFTFRTSLLGYLADVTEQLPPLSHDWRDVASRPWSSCPVVGVVFAVGRCYRRINRGHPFPALPTMSLTMPVYSACRHLQQKSRVECEGDDGHGRSGSLSQPDVCSFRDSRPCRIFITEARRPVIPQAGCYREALICLKMQLRAWHIFETWVMRHGSGHV